MDNVKNILENVKNGNISVDEALLKLKIEDNLINYKAKLRCFAFLLYIEA